jgi:hypothetical protein
MLTGNVGVHFAMPNNARALQCIALISENRVFKPAANICQYRQSWTRVGSARVGSGRVQISVSSGGSGRVKKFEYFYSRFFANCKILHGLKNCNVNSTYLVSGSGRDFVNFGGSGRGQAPDGSGRQKVTRVQLWLRI